jgi:hypothetical protein
MAGARTSPPATWVDFYEREIQENRCGSIQSYNGLASSYVNDVPGLGQLIDDREGEGVLTVAGSSKTIRLLHQVFEDADRGRVLGLSGVQRCAPLKEIASSHLVAPMLIPATRSAREKIIPSFDDFVRTESADEFATLEGSGVNTIGDLTSFPQSAWVHPALLSEHLLNGARASSAGHAIASLANQEGQEAPEEKYYNLMLFLWSIEQGLVQSRAMYDPPLSQATNDRLVAINRKLERLPSTGRNNETRVRSRSRSQRGPPRRSGSQHRDTPNRDAIRHGICFSQIQNTSV